MMTMMMMMHSVWQQKLDYGFSTTYHLQLDLNGDGSTFDARHAGRESTPGTGHAAQWRAGLGTYDWATDGSRDCGSVGRCYWQPADVVPVTINRDVN